MPKRKVTYTSIFKKYHIGKKLTGSMAERLAEVEISKDGDVYIARITLPTGEVVNMENEELEDVLEQIANDLGERFSN